MATNVSWNGSTYAVPATGEDNWGGTTKVDGLLIALATHGFSKSGGLFTLGADADFGATAGLKAVYYKSRGTVADTGILRLAKTESVAWRNNADSGNNTLATDTSDRLLYNGTVVLSSTGVVAVAAGGTGLSSYTTGDLLYASASTTLAKLGIGAANRILSSSGSAPAWSLLVNANVDAAAAIARSKLASGTADHVLINDGSGVMSSEAALSAARGGTGVSNNAASTWTISGNYATTVTVTNTTTVTLPTSGTLATLAGTESFSNKSFSDPITMAHVSTPSNPAAGNAKLYVKSDNTLYLLTPAGLEQTVTAAAEKTASDELTGLTLSASISSNILTVALKDKDGNDPSAAVPVKIGFRNATATTGTYAQVSVTGALSLTIGTTASLGLTTATANTIYIYALNNAGTVELFASSHCYWDEGRVQSTSTTATSNAVLYGANARSNMAVRLIGRVKATWTSGVGWSSLANVDLLPFDRNPVLAAKYETGAGQSISTGSAQVVNFGTKNIDTHNAVTTGASWVFTAPAAGLYEVKAQILFVSGGGWDSGDLGFLGLRKNTSLLKYLYMYFSNGAHSVNVGLLGSETVYLVAGDTIDITVLQNTGGAIALDAATTENYISVTRIGASQ